jgi:membrane associated rhomboid family serine protease
MRLTCEHGVDRGRGMTTSTPGGRMTSPGGQRTAPWGKWSISERDAQAIVAEARKAFFVMAGILVVLWIIQIINWADHYQLTLNNGIVPRDITRLPDIFAAPFLHFSWAHIEGNSGPLFIFGFLAAYRGVKKFAAVTVLVIITSGLAAWLFEPANTVGAGASGVVFGYFGYIMVRGFFDRHLIDMLIGVIMALCFAYQFAVLVPQAGIGWQAHIGGLVGGVLAGWLFRDKRPRDSGKPAPVTQAARPVTGMTFPRPQADLPRKPTSPA